MNVRNEKRKRGNLMHVCLRDKLSSQLIAEMQLSVFELGEKLFG